MSCLLMTGRHPEELDISLTSLWEILSIARAMIYGEFLK